MLFTDFTNNNDTNCISNWMVFLLISVSMCMAQYQFEKLGAWQKSRSLIKFIYLDTRNFPKSELFGLTNQIRRSSISVASNLSEGTGRAHAREKTQFYNTAYASLMELLNQLIISCDIGFITEYRLNSFYRPQIEQLSLMIHKLANNPNPRLNT